MPDHYEVLDVLPSSSQDEIKRRYRELVRENHPDIAPDREAAHARMQVILTAYGVLSNPDSRARYDRERLQREEQAHMEQRSARGREAAPTTGAGMAVPEVVRRARAAQNARSREAGGQGRNPRTRQLTMVFEAAQMFFVENRAGDAANLCHRVLQADPRNPEAAALLGDIYLSQERRDLALLMFERAMRAQPTNLLYKQKWNALRRNEPVPASNFAPQQNAAPAPSAPDENAPSEPRAPDVAPAPETPLRAKLGLTSDAPAPEKAKGKSLFGKLFGKA